MYLVASADHHAIEPRHCRFADFPQAFLRLDDRPHPLPVIAGTPNEHTLFIEIGAVAECAVACSGQDHRRDPVIPRRVLERATHFPQRGEVEGVEDVWPVDDHPRYWRLFLIADVTELERGWGLRQEVHAKADVTRPERRGVSPALGRTAAGLLPRPGSQASARPRASPPDHQNTFLRSGSTAARPHPACRCRGP